MNRGLEAILSLPLMGIWNVCTVPLDDLLLALITPHGDLEPATLERQTVYPTLLITPHGDLEPRRRAPSPAPASNLITPHGDLEHTSGAAAPNTLYNSLPLMGIWNPVRLLPVGGFEVLITPHGDLERLRRV